MSDFKKMLNFEGKNIVVSGGLGLIGSSVCDAFLEFGGNVIVADIDEKKFEKMRSGKGDVAERLCFEYFDISDRENAGNHIQDMIKHSGNVDVWVNLAYPKTADWSENIEDVSFGSWDENMRIHLGGYFWTSKLVLEHMKNQKKGVLINFGSIYGIVGPHFDIYENTGMTVPVAYSAIKGAIVNLSRYFAALYGPFNVRVNTVCPGGVEDGQDGSFIERYSKLTPLRRMARPEEAALPTVFLASEGASYINGHTLMVDGGWTII